MFLSWEPVDDCAVCEHVAMCSCGPVGLPVAGLGEWGLCLSLPATVMFFEPLNAPPMKNFFLTF